MPPGVDRADPRASILLADDLSGMPPTYLVTAGFDPIRDEGEMFAGGWPTRACRWCCAGSPTWCTASST